MEFSITLLITRAFKKLLKMLGSISDKMVLGQMLDIMR